MDGTGTDQGRVRNGQFSLETQPEEDLADIDELCSVRDLSRMLQYADDKAIRASQEATMSYVHPCHVLMRASSHQALTGDERHKALTRTAGEDDNRKNFREAGAHGGGSSSKRTDRSCL